VLKEGAEEDDLPTMNVGEYFRSGCSCDGGNRPDLVSSASYLLTIRSF